MDERHARERKRMMMAGYQKNKPNNKKANRGKTSTRKNLAKILRWMDTKLSLESILGQR